MRCFIMLSVSVNMVLNIKLIQGPADINVADWLKLAWEVE